MTDGLQDIDGHNKVILKMNNTDNKTQLDNGCNCKSRDKCSLPGKYLTKSIVYPATVSTNDRSNISGPHIKHSFKTRLANHKTTFSNVKRRMQY